MAATPHKLLGQLFEYIEEQLKIIDPRGFQLSRHSGFKREPKDVLGLPGIEFDIKLEGDHVWLRIDRLEEDTPPQLTESQKELLSIGSDPFGSLPTLNQVGISHRISQKKADKKEKNFEQIEAEIFAIAETELKKYIELWKAWAEGEKPRRKTIGLYGDLFTLKHQMELEETARPSELLWGIGVSKKNLVFNDEKFLYHYPLLTQAVEVSLDEKTMSLEIRPRTTDTRLELDAFVVCQLTGASEVERAAREHLAKHKEQSVTPFDSGSFSDVLKLIVTNMDSKGSYREVMASRAEVTDELENLTATDAWVLFSRPRSNNYLVEDLKRLRSKIAGGCEIPAGPLALVTAPSNTPIEFQPVNFRGISSRGEGGSGHGEAEKKGEVKELYFPLPYNNEQVTIVHRLERAAGVTVQGPPGTGKTHTIANIICHYLAIGRRVLVTSRGEPALEVLQSKIPDEIRPLTVALLTNDREGMRQFQGSIEAIQHRVSQLNTGETEQQIKTIHQAIDRAHRELGKIDRQIDEMALSQLSEIDVDGVNMNAQKLAELVISGTKQHSWFDDVLSLSSEHMPCFSEDEAASLRESRRKLGQDLIYTQAILPSADDLCSPSEVEEIHNALSQMKKLDEYVKDGTLIPLRGFTNEIVKIARDLLNNIQEAILLLEELEALKEPWPLDLRVKCRQKSFETEKSALEALFVDLKYLIEARADFLNRPVNFPEEGLNEPQIRDAVAYAVKNGRPFAIPWFANKEVRKIISSVTISGHKPKNEGDWEHIQCFLILQDSVISFMARWNQLAVILGVPLLSGSVNSLRQIEIIATAALKTHKLATFFDPILGKKAESVFDKSLSKEILGSSADLCRIRDQLLRHLSRVDLAKAAANLSTLQGKLSGKTGAISEELSEFVATDLGNPKLTASVVCAKYAELCAELRRIAALTIDLMNVKDCARRLASVGAVRLAIRVCSVPVLSSGDETVFPTTWRQSWTWARVRSHLEKIECRKELLNLTQRRQDLEKGLARLYKEMVSKTAWLKTKQNATPKVLQALAGYATAVRRIGQGTGPNAVRYRKDARLSMLDAAGAVPCWIMSHSKISECMPADIGFFDLVIVDEASQSDLWALPAIVRGKKILVVGDDKQVSPDGGFISSKGINELQNRFLADQPFGSAMTPEKSLYDLASRVFAAEQVMLREHFRCVPHIIAYSNKTFYQGSIHPLRIPKASERLDPPLVDIHVKNGMRDSKNCNIPEAEAICEEICALLEDEKFANRSIGVVSLLGPDQAKIIDSLVRQRCPAGELHQRRFECGDARTFQGSERDIMFLSLVVDPSDCRALSGNMYEQRFNVGASRARDRMYIVRSVEASDLSEKDLRLTLLNYFSKPLVVEEAEIENLLDRCESGFEKDVYTHLIKKGFRVTPQVRTGAFRIDMVVEGADDTRLAIECDGDEYHGPDRWQHDMSRQRMLERAGWTFWRCFASTWTLQKEEVFNELLEHLSAMGIEPVGVMERAPAFVEKRTWSYSEKKDEAVDKVLEQAIEDSK